MDDQLTAAEAAEYASVIRSLNASGRLVYRRAQRTGGHLWVFLFNGPNFPEAECSYWCLKCNEQAVAYPTLRGDVYHLDRKGECLLRNITPDRQGEVAIS